MTPQVLIEKLCQLAPEVMDTCGFWAAPSRCIAATRIGTEVLRVLGYEAEPMVVIVQAGNREFFKYGPLVEKGKMSSAAAKAKGARLVCIDNRSNTPGEGYPGHLVVLLPQDKVMVDLDIGQFARPGIVVPPAVSLSVTSAFLNGTEPLLYGLPREGFIYYRRIANPTPWQTAPDWSKESRWRRPVRRLVAQLRPSTPET